jgi:hypothetical protein
MDSSEEDFRTIADTYARVMKEDKALCDRAQANLNAGVFINGELHPRWEKGRLGNHTCWVGIVTDLY